MAAKHGYRFLQDRKYKRRRFVALCLLFGLVASLTWGVESAVSASHGVADSAAAAEDAAQSDTQGDAQDGDASGSDVADSQSGSDVAADGSTDAASSDASASADPDITAQVQGSLDSIFAGAQYSVEVTNLKTGATKVSIGADEQFTSASTYKLYIAYSMIFAVENGTVTWNSSLNGTTLRSCFSDMIIQSDNAFPTAWLEKYGFQAVSQQVAQAGFSGTQIAHADMRTTPADLTDYLTRLYSGTSTDATTGATTDFMDADSRAYLIQCMESQIYRSGIPAGIGDSGTVADKVGFLDGLLHDAAIIYTDKGDYTMVIMTDGSSWGAIAQAAATIYAAL